MSKLILTLIVFLILFFNAGNIYAYNPQDVQNNIFGIGIINHSDLDDASKLVNNNGDWGYVTVVITENQMDRSIWQEFFNQCRKKHLIPIIRVATTYDNNWQIPDIEKIDSWVNFFNSLNWVIENKYIIIGNEPNHAKEWGGKIEPEAYALYLKTFATRLKNANNGYFVLNAGFDQAAGNTKVTMDQKKYMDRMVKEIPDVFNFIDGFASHSYPNPAFSGSEKGNGRKSIKGYEWELNLLKSYGVTKDLPVFITETGWIRNNKNSEKISQKMKYAFENVWGKDKRIVAVTPFILNYENPPFYEFSWKKSSTEFFPIYNTIQNMQKVEGKPVQKINGEIIFSFLNPFIINNTKINGYALVKNSGQNIWNKQNVTLKLSGNSFEIDSMEIKDIQPFTTGIILYSIKVPEYTDIQDLTIGFFVNEKYIGNVYKGKIIKIKI